MPHDVFLSYSRNDLDSVKPIKQELECRGFSCWMDLTGIESGEENFKRKVIPGIKSTRGAFLFFLSDKSQDSEYALKEIGFAKHKRKHVVLVRFNDDKMTDDFYFDYQNADIIDWRKPAEKEKLLKDLVTWTGHVPSAPPATGSSGNQPPKKKKDVVFRAIACGALAAVAFALLLVFGGGEGGTGCFPRTPPTTTFPPPPPTTTFPPPPTNVVPRPVWKTFLNSAKLANNTFNLTCDRQYQHFREESKNDGFDSCTGCVPHVVGKMTDDVVRNWIKAAAQDRTANDAGYTILRKGIQDAIDPFLAECGTAASNLVERGRSHEGKLFAALCAFTNDLDEARNAFPPLVKERMRKADEGAFARPRSEFPDGLFPEQERILGKSVDAVVALVLADAKREIDAEVRKPVGPERINAKRAREALVRDVGKTLADIAAKLRKKSNGLVLDAAARSARAFVRQSGQRVYENAVKEPPELER